MIYILVFAVAAFVEFCGCKSLRLESLPESAPDSWPMYGGAPSRCNQSSSPVEPPLSVCWEFDASAGFGASAASAGKGFLFVGNLQGEVYAVQISTGEQAGVKDFGTAVSGTPLISGDTLYIALEHDEAGLVAYSLKTGSVIWSVKTGDIETSPLLFGGAVYIASMNGKLLRINRETGSIAWTYSLPGRAGLNSIHSSPTGTGNIVVFGCDNGQILAVGAGDGTLKWRARTGAAIIATPSISDSVVFAGSLDSCFYALDAATGRLLWKRLLGDRIYASQAADRKRVYAATAGGALYCLDAADGAVMWRTQTGGPISAPPLLSGGTIYVGCIDKILYAFDKDTGKETWRYKASGRIKTAPVIFGERLFLFAENRSVTAFMHKEGE